MSSKNLQLSEHALHSRSRYGFSLIEMTIVLLILGILAGVTAPKYVDSMQELRVQSAARKVVADFEFARQEALSQGVSKTLVFNFTNNAYEILGTSDPDHSNLPYTISLAGEPYAVTLSNSAGVTDGSPVSVTYNPFGRPDVGGSLILSTGDKQRTVTINRASGRATVQP